MNIQLIMLESVIIGFEKSLIDHSNNEPSLADYHTQYAYNKAWVKWSKQYRMLSDTIADKKEQLKGVRL